MSAPANYASVDPTLLVVPTDTTGIQQFLTDLRGVVIAMNHNLTEYMRINGQDLSTVNTTLQAQDASLSNLDTLMVRALAQQPSTTAVAAQGKHRAPKLAEPSKFDGTDRNKALSFRVAVTHYLRISYPQATVEEQIAYIISVLDGKAHAWLESYLDKDIIQNLPITWLHNIDQFWTEFNSRWNVSNQTENFRAKFRALIQGNKSVQEYYKDFQTYSQNLGYNDVSLRDFFYDGLSIKVKESIMLQNFDYADAAVTLHILADKALQIDQRLEAFKLQTKNTSSSTSHTPSSGSKTTSSPSAASPTGNARGKMTVGEKVYVQGSDGRARKGEITSIVRNEKGQSVPTIKWNDGKSETASFRDIKRDSHPIVAPSSSSQGPSPMDLDAAGKGKKPIVCNNCGGKGHYATACPSRPFSGQGAEILESESENEDI